MELSEVRDGISRGESLPPAVAKAVLDRLAEAEAVIANIVTLLETPSDERGITWWEWIDGGLGGSLHDDLRAVLAAYTKGTEQQ